MFRKQGPKRVRAINSIRLKKRLWAKIEFAAFLVIFVVVDGFVVVIVGFVVVIVVGFVVVIVEFVVIVVGFVVVIVVLVVVIVVVDIVVVIVVVVVVVVIVVVVIVVDFVVRQFNPAIQFKKLRIGSSFFSVVLKNYLTFLFLSYQEKCGEATMVRIVNWSKTSLKFYIELA